MSNKSEWKRTQEAREMALRTTTEIMENALKAMKMCAEEWPEYQPDYRQMRDTVERLRTAAQGFGYVGRGVKR